ncbi:MAG: hypothetical protein IPP41_11975 [Rhodocyclaceae bacterium]|nr:hypothetical protein [Rhodocyclaceae bacterium]
MSAANKNGSLLASGSNPPDAYVICPRTMGTLAKVAAGMADDLISRAADEVPRRTQANFGGWRISLLGNPSENMLACAAVRDFATQSGLLSSSARHQRRGFCLSREFRSTWRQASIDGNAKVGTEKLTSSPRTASHWRSQVIETLEDVRAERKRW